MSKPSMSEVLPRGHPSSALALRAGSTRSSSGLFGKPCGFRHCTMLRVKPCCGRYHGWPPAFVAHFVHRRFTFDGRRNVRTTVLGAISVYAVGMMGSTLSFDVMLDLLTTFSRFDSYSCSTSAFGACSHGRACAGLCLATPPSKMSD